MLRNAHGESPHYPPNLNLLHRHGRNEALEGGDAREEEAESPHADMAKHNTPEIKPRDIGKEHQHNQILTEEIAEEDGVGKIVHGGRRSNGDGDDFEKKTL